MTATAQRRRRPRDERLVPVIRTTFFPNFRNHRKECWGAKTVDGVWTFEREESTGTPWLVRHQPSVDDRSYELPIHLASTLSQARIFVGAGWAETTLAMLKCSHPADQRGHRVSRGTLDYHYETCKVCAAERQQHDDDDGCKTCDDYLFREGKGHEWSPAIPASMAVA